MKAVDLVKKVQDNPQTLVLHDIVRFRRRTRENPVDFYDFVQALTASRSIQHVIMHGNLSFGFPESEWMETLQAIGRMQCLQKLSFMGDVPIALPLSIMTAVLHNARTLRSLSFFDGVILVGEASAVPVFADALEKSQLESFTLDGMLRLRDVLQVNDSRLEPIALGLSRCPTIKFARIVHHINSHLTYTAVRTLTSSRSLRELQLDHGAYDWSKIAAALKGNGCTVTKLSLMARTTTEEGCRAISEALKVNVTLKRLSLSSRFGFTSPMCVALADGLRVNRTLECLEICTSSRFTLVRGDQSGFDATTYKAFSDILQQNHGVQVVIKDDRHDRLGEAVSEARTEFMIQSHLNELGRGALLKDTARLRPWIDAIVQAGSRFDTSLELDLVFTLFRSNPLLCQGKGNGSVE